MVIFLTSSPTGDLDGSYLCDGIDNRNGFADNLRKYWRPEARVLMITAFPGEETANAEMREFFENAFDESGFSMSCFDLWDWRVLDGEELHSRAVLHSYDVVVLGGGHVPTQNAFFKMLNLRETIAGFDGIVIGISAGSMNAADIVYAQPEEPGEAADPYYARFIEGLGITNINVLPHLQLVRNSTIDGLRLFEDISFPDSCGREFICLPDGSYVVDWNGMTRLGDGRWALPEEPAICGEAYLLRDGEMQKL